MELVLEDSKTYGDRFFVQKQEEFFQAASRMTRASRKKCWITY
jgi:hypothetical protein